MKAGLILAGLIGSTLFINQYFTVQTDPAVFCKVGYSKTRRPPVIITQTIKRLYTSNPAKYELDHIVALENGGCPLCLNNLQLQEWSLARHKDAEENAIHRKLCNP